MSLSLRGSLFVSKEFYPEFYLLFIGSRHILHIIIYLRCTAATLTTYDILDVSRVSYTSIVIISECNTYAYIYYTHLA